MKLSKEQLVEIIKEVLSEELPLPRNYEAMPEIQQNMHELANTVYHFDDTTIPLLAGLVDNLDQETAAAAKDLLQRVKQLKSDMRKYSGV